MGLGERRRLHNEELNDLYSMRVIKSGRMEWAGHLAHVEDRRCAYRVTVGIPEGKRTLGRSRRTWEDNIKKDRQELGWGNGLDRSGLRIGTGGGSFLSEVMNPQVS